MHVSKLLESVEVLQSTYTVVVENKDLVEGRVGKRSFISEACTQYSTVQFSTVSGLAG